MKPEWICPDCGIRFAMDDQGSRSRAEAHYRSHNKLTEADVVDWFTAQTPETVARVLVALGESVLREQPHPLWDQLRNEWTECYCGGRLDHKEES